MKELTTNAEITLKQRYLLKDEKGEVIETIPEMYDRIAGAIAEAENNYNNGKENYSKQKEIFHDMMADLYFLPNSPTLMNAGTPDGQLSACFVLPIEDSIESIFETLKKTALIHKSGGGTGFSFSRIREKDAIVKTTGGIASGPISFMKVYNAATEEVKQGGKRRGAAMAMLRVDHPDILDFIDCKTVDGVLNNFNISVALTDSFMEAVKEDKEYDLISPKNGKVVRTLKAKEVFEKLVNNAWNNGEPGIFFIDRANQYNPTPKEGDYESTNPCGEQILLPNESCNLGSINLANFVIKDGKGFKDKWNWYKSLNGNTDFISVETLLGRVIDFDLLKFIVENAVRFLDDVIDVNCFPFKEIEQQTKRNRKIGLGIMGFAELLLKIGVPYNSELGRKVAEALMKFISNTSINASIKLARERGVFPTYEDSTWKLMDAKMRNATVTTLAPTGTISLIAGTSSGIEPYFSFAYERHILDGKTLLERNELLAEVLKEYGIYSDELIKKIVDNHGMLKGIEGIPEEISSVFVSAHEISPKDHILMQASFQKYVDNAISKTINFTNDATKEDIYNAFMLAYDSGCKGTTVYRDGSRSTQVLTTSSKKEDTTSNIDVYNRPKKLYGSTKTVQIGCGKILVTVNHDNNNKVKEVIITSGKGGGCHAQSEAIGRLISISLRANVDINEIIHQLRGIRCDACKKKGLDGISCPDAIGRYIEEEQKYLDGEEIHITPPVFKEEEKVEEPENESNKCPQCGAQLAHESGCVKCYNCDYSKCG